MSDARQAGEISQRVLDAWALIYAGAKSKIIDKVWNGNAALLMYEQQEILQKKFMKLTKLKAKTVGGDFTRCPVANPGPYCQFHKLCAQWQYRRV
jgi:hypothetical protein